ncbi:hypothetical protein [Pseudomonas sp. nanlin1]|uniref:hypothetical protein n=1 Tax=Pseudomonas sp. nanlin1 TaxID=3040605 RepID=UPI0038902133
MSPTPPPSTLARLVRQQFADLPTLRSVLTPLLQKMLAELYPQVSLDATRLQIALPQDNASWHAVSLSDMALAYLDSGQLPDFSPKAGLTSFLTVQLPHPITLGYERLDVQSLKALLQALPSVLVREYQQAVLDTWQTPLAADITRLTWLATVYRQLWWAASDSLSEVRALIRQVLATPQKTERTRRYADAAVVAYVVNATLSSALPAPAALVLVQGTHVVLCELSGRCTHYPSQEVCTAAWSAKLRGDDTSLVQLQWAEVHGDPCLMQAQLVLDEQLRAVGLIKFATGLSIEALEKAFADQADVSAYFSQTEILPDATRERLTAALPSWLEQAASADVLRYQQHWAGLAAAQQRAAGKSFDEGLLPLRDYASAQIRQALQADYPQATGLDPDALVITSHVAGGVPGGWGLIEKSTWTVVDLALENLAGFPKGPLTVGHRDGLALPEGLDNDYLRGLVQRLDIGLHYPALVASTLGGDSAQSGWRQALYADQLRHQLPLLALELKVRGQAGLSEVGYGYVAQLLQPPADPTVAATVVALPLAFLSGSGAQPDPVANMFVFAAPDMTGPVVIYRPFGEHCLQEFADVTQFIAALGDDTELAHSVLAWMSAQAQRVYAHGGFAEPHLGIGVDDPGFVPVREAVQLSAQPVVGDLLLALYQAHVAAWVGLADDQSVSNTESRWKTLQEGGWLAFNVVLPLLRGPLAAAGWLLQLMSNLDHDFAALKSGDVHEKAAAIVDLLFNVSTASLFIGQSLAPHEPLRLPADPRLLASASAPHESAAAPIGFASSLEQLPVPTPASTSLAERLQVLRVTPADNLPAPILEGERAGLHALGDDLYAQVGVMWFKVVEEEGGVVIVDPYVPARKGPWLQRDADHRWHLDLKLRLRGGAPVRKPVQQTRASAERAIAARRERLAAAIALENTAQARFNVLRPSLQGLLANLRLEAEVLRGAAEAGNPEPFQNLLQAAQRRVKAYMPPIRDYIVQCEGVVSALDGMYTEIETGHRVGLFDVVERQQMLTSYFRHRRRAHLDARNRHLDELALLNLRDYWKTRMQGIPLNATPAAREAMLELYRQEEAVLERIHYHTLANERLLSDALGQGLTLDQLNAIEAVVPALESAIPADAIKVSWIETLILTALETTISEAAERVALARRLYSTAYSSALASERVIMTHPEFFTRTERFDVMRAAAQTYGEIKGMAEHYARRYPAVSSSESYFWRLARLFEGLERSAWQWVDATSAVAAAPDPAQPVANQYQLIRAVAKVFVGIPTVREQQQVADIGLDTFARVDGSYEWVLTRKLPAEPLLPLESGYQMRLRTQQMLEASAAELARINGCRRFYRTGLEITFQVNDLFYRIKRLVKQYQRITQLDEADNRAIQSLVDNARHVASEGVTLRMDYIRSRGPTLTDLRFAVRNSKAEVVLVGPRSAHADVGFVDEYEVRIQGTPACTWYLRLAYSSADAARGAFTEGWLATAEQRAAGYPQPEPADTQAWAQHNRLRVTPVVLDGWFPY